MKYVIFSLVSILIVACSDPQSPATDQINKVAVHPAGWTDPSSENFHGDLLAQADYDNSSCQQCHGNNFDGGLVDESCRKCHASYPHADSWVSGHRSYLKSTRWNLQECQSCHGENYDLVKLNRSCLTCHSQAGGPEACNTCHGDFRGDASNPITWAPPEGLGEETDPAERAVGAHQAHLQYFSHLTGTEACQECHVVPASFDDPSHIDDQPGAEVVFGSLAKFVTEGGARIPAGTYDSAANSCSNVYCHGDWGLLRAQSSNNFVYVSDKMQGDNAVAKWTDPVTGDCGTCHALAPAGHSAYDVSACSGCHSGVMDANGNIIDNTKHVNGKVNVFGQEYPMF